ncbi:MAG TPA: class I SAM-dependent methyltransferase [Candidatus Saccharimonadales bacterium]|nr:class I SAM-dependent methyltransferase [Candidatus Saccharimonadales bacterium]
MQSESAPLTPGIVFETMQAMQKTAALRAAIELGIFAAIGKGSHDVASIARHASASERGIRILCDFLVVNGLLQKIDGCYQHTPSSAAFLDPASPHCLASVARFLSLPELLKPYDHLADIVRTGRTVLEGEGTVAPENPVWVEFAQAMAPMMAPMAGPLGEVVLKGRREPMRVLDIAAGHGLFGIEIAKQNPRAHVTGLDWAPVLCVALDNARKAGVQERYDMLPGSAFDVDFRGPYDAILLTNFLHHFDIDTCVSLLKKVRAALRPGGCAATLEFVPNEDRVSPPMPAGFAMTMLATTASGDAYTFRELADMHTRAGFGPSTAHPIPQSPHTIVMAANPAS